MPAPTSPVYCAAVDLGATSGRVILGSWANGSLTTQEVHRFPNEVRALNGHAYWDIPGLWQQVQQGLVHAAGSIPAGGKLASVGVDTWGVDHVLTDATGNPVYPFFAYRDDRTQQLLADLQAHPGQLRRIYRATGIPAVFYNTSLQLAAAVAAHPGLKRTAARCLFLPDYFNFLLSGKMSNGQSIAGTAQLLDISRGGWSAATLRHFKIPPSWLGAPTRTGKNLGPVKGIAALKGTRVIAVPGHDTTCAYDAIPAAADGSDILLSSGTWSIVGMESDRALLSDEALAARIANDQTGRGEIRPLANVTGLWLMEQTLREFAARPTTTGQWNKLVSAAARLPAPSRLLDVNDPAFGNPPSMRAAINAQLKRHRVKPPQELVEYVRLICDSLGQGHADVVARLARLSGCTFKRIIMVGGGAKNKLLCQATANATALPLMACEVEGSAVGNIANQLIALRVVKNLATFRQLLLPQLKTRTFKPKR